MYMATKKTAAKKVAAKAAKKVAAKAAENMGAVNEDEVVTPAEEVEVSKDAKTISATGKFEVVEIKPGSFRMFNERGVAVSPVVLKGDTLENGKPALAKLVRECRRANVLRQNRQIATPRGHETV